MFIINPSRACRLGRCVRLGFSAVATLSQALARHTQRSSAHLPCSAMAEEEEDLPPKPEMYTLTTETGAEKPCSIAYTGEGTARYMNGDEYKGLFANGNRCVCVCV